MAAAAAALALAADHLGAITDDPVVPWFVLLGLFFATDVWVVHLPVGRNRWSFSLSEIPLFLAVLTLPPLLTVVLRTAGAGIGLPVARVRGREAVVQRRQRRAGGGRGRRGPPSAPGRGRSASARAAGWRASAPRLVINVLSGISISAAIWLTGAHQHPRLATGDGRHRGRQRPRQHRPRRRQPHRDRARPVGRHGAGTAGRNTSRRPPRLDRTAPALRPPPSGARLHLVAGRGLRHRGHGASACWTKAGVCSAAAERSSSSPTRRRAGWRFSLDTAFEAGRDQLLVVRAAGRRL